MFYQTIPTTVEALTFDELVQYGRENCPLLVSNMPWSFVYKGFPVTHENNQRYLITTKDGTLSVYPTDVVVSAGDAVTVVQADKFHATHTPVPIV